MNWEGDNERSEFMQHFAVLAETFDKKCSKELIRIYARSLEKFPVETVAKAIDTAVVSCRFFPKPVELIEFCAGGDLEDQSEVEWKKVIDTVRKYGGDKSVVFDDPSTMAVIDTWGGWIRLCEELTHQNLPFRKKDFKSTWKSFKSSGIEKTGRLAGFFDQQNSLHGYHDSIQDPIFVGDENRAQIIWRRGEPEVLEISHDDAMDTAG
jgi:hypothetical protein